ncbi:MAG: hypothetical protein AUK44_00475 [Porphyromonadaceae bacterium CG2_30_38_12]|nr:MAG: hypothetical protein AUK44_00475 [Porphyromonadaceae bacterium CG2_30_38_12]
MELENLRTLHHICTKQQIPFVSFRLPAKSEITSYIQHLSIPQTLVSLDNLADEIGFLFSAFAPSDTNKTYLLQPDNIILNGQVETEFLTQLYENNNFIKTRNTQNNLSATTSIESYVSQINEAKAAMQQGKLVKVVLSKVCTEHVPDNFNIAAMFERLCSKYTQAFVYLIQIPEMGCWLGATPEPLLTVEQNTYRTVSLAGTQIATGKAIHEYTWTSKEIEEQAIVTNFIAQSIADLGIENILQKGPINYQAGNLIHLQTIFEFRAKPSRQLIPSLLKALHPTPSIGGLPRQEALSFIEKTEKHDRSYYTGLLGSLQANEESQIFVNLRCMQYTDNQLIFYSGAGITSSSIAENEWYETENKMQTLKQVLEE